MNARQRKFIDEYLIDLNAAQAAIRAGYNPNSARITGAKLLTKANIRTYIDNELERLHNEKVADIQEIMEYLTSVMRGERKEETLKLAGEGIQTIEEIAVSAKERIRAAELLGKRYGLFSDKVDMSITAPVVISGAEMLSDDVPEPNADDKVIQHSRYQKE